MRSYTTKRFWESFYCLPKNIQTQAKQSYSKFQENPYHPSLHFKRIHSTQPIYSVRINLDYRALGVLNFDEVIWFWIGSHAEYNHLIKRLPKKV